MCSARSAGLAVLLVLASMIGRLRRTFWTPLWCLSKPDATVAVVPHGTPLYDGRSMNARLREARVSGASWIMWLSYDDHDMIRGRSCLSHRVPVVAPRAPD
jgi:hypothetical protein